jgi:type II secretory pathway pseudopilin PulG
MKINTRILRPTALSRRRSIAAFTMIETIVATLLAAIMLPTLYAGLGAGFSFVRATRENLRATQVILQRMEAVRLSPYTAIQDPAAYPTNVTEYYCPSSQTNGNGGTVYTVTYNCAPGPASLPPSYRSNVVLVTVTAGWKAGNVQCSRSMQSYVARYGIQRYVSAN